MKVRLLHGLPIFNRLLAELADAADSKPAAREGVQVQLLCGRPSLTMQREHHARTTRRGLVQTQVAKVTGRIVIKIARVAECIRGGLKPRWPKGIVGSSPT